MIRVGMLRQFKKPNSVALAAALAANILDMEFFFFNPENVDPDRNKIMGLFYEEGHWVRKETNFPDVIDNSPPTKLNQEIYNKLKESVPFTTHRIGSKDFIYNRLMREKLYQNLLIPTKKVDTTSDVLEYLAEYKKIILKPQRGNRGRGIYYIEDRNSYYLIIANKEKIELEKNKIDTFIENEITHKNYIVQRYIQSLTKDNLPFDIRIHVRRDINAEWKVVKIYPRIGTNDGITSNVSQGGYIGQIDKFLKRQFGDKYLTVHDELTKLAKEFPVYFQKGYNYNIDALGIDIGIDDNCKLWLFEVNSYPGSTFFELESQIVAMGYAKYLAQQEKQRHIIKT